MKKNAVLILVIAVLGGMFWWNQQSVSVQNEYVMSDVEIQDSGSMDEVQEMIVDGEAADQKVVTVLVEEEGQIVFDLLSEQQNIEYKQYDFGVFVESINGIAGDDDHFWALYLNGELSPTGADQTVVSPQDLVEFKYEEIK